MKNKLCVIIGFGTGVGMGLARAFGKEGYSLALLARDPNRHANLLAELENAGYTAQAYSADAGDDASLTAAIAAAESELGDIHVLLYNAIVPTFVKPTGLTAERLVADFRVNVAGALTATLAVLPGMKTRGHGTILFTGGGWALQPWDQAASPSIGKAGLRSLAHTLAQELAPTGIHVGTVIITGQVAEGTYFSPDNIATAFLELHCQPADQFATELIFQSPPQT